LEQARTMRGTIVPALFMNLTYHLEHHLYPQVPGMNLRRLALRLDPLLAARGLRPTHVL
jgi:beta-carotene hydroxylase